MSPRFEVKFVGCPTCGGDHYRVIDTLGEFKPTGTGKNMCEKLAEALNERWEKILETEKPG